MESDLFKIFFIIGIVTEAMSGGLLAWRKRMDVVGVIFIGVITAIGGGSIRDVLFDHHPLVWIKHPEYLIMLALASFVAIVIPKIMIKLEKAFLVLDAVGLVVFAIIGASLQVEKGLILSIVSGVITGVFGGILRDILCNQTPLIFHKEIYASVAIISAGLFYILSVYTKLPQLYNVIIVMSICVTLRLLVIHFRISLPNIDSFRRF